MKNCRGALLSKDLSRRHFLEFSSMGSLALAREKSGGGVVSPVLSLPRGAGAGSPQAKPTSIREFLRDLTCLRQEVDTFLDLKQPNWAKFDPELGYTLRDNVLKDGVDGSRTLTSYEKTGERKMINYAHLPCRINTYGDSFTQCHQASDGETWQEYLAAHSG